MKFSGNLATLFYHLEIHHTKFLSFRNCINTNKLNSFTRQPILLSKNQRSIVLKAILVCTRLIVVIHSV